MRTVTTAQDSGDLSFCEQFFGLQEAPFSMAPDPRYLFESASHVTALTQLALAIERREPLVVVTGEIGTGKTLLCRLVLERQKRQTFVSIINNSLLGRDDLLKQLLQDFGVISKDRTMALEASRHDLVHALEDFLASLITLRAHAVVIIDEAQHIQFDVLEQIRLLSNIGEARGTALQIILVGQGDLDAILLRPEMRHFQQRVSRRLRLEPLSAEELPLYIEHRLSSGSYGDEIEVARRGRARSHDGRVGRSRRGRELHHRGDGHDLAMVRRYPARRQPSLRPRDGSGVHTAGAYD